ncbi:MAG: radical SAM family heme chaperone HemW [Flavobacteriaceae bacterium]|nr:radical SAM family heme chaperone HemW [Flavobacteriaceae bacterium]MBL6870368.1 radical SAM family heme chaperone HemW [Flavobacteriaceae bacterium]
MANLYIHYPFCKQACHYCNFHFSTGAKGRDQMMELIEEELQMRASELKSPLESIYFGGGSPSLISTERITSFISKVTNQFDTVEGIEITLEVNPDDVDEDYLRRLKLAGINRLSLGIQSFSEKDLRLMHRAHDRKEAENALKAVKKHFENFSLDLIYGMPDSSIADWEESLSHALSYDPPHISAYALTVEEKTVLHHLVNKDKVTLLPEETVKEQYDLLVALLEQKKYINYEFSSFGKPNFFSVNNQNYWNGKAYLGLGPSAHSFDGQAKRSWNISNNHLYASGVQTRKLDREIEQLNTKDRYNEYIMTALRKQEGVSLAHIKNVFGKTHAAYLEEQVSRHLAIRNLFWDGDHLKIVREAKFLTDGIAADLFLI